MLYPSAQSFSELASIAPIVPVVQRVYADLYTPISIFRTFGNEKDAFLLESVIGGERWARYSIMGRRPILKYIAKGNDASFYKKNQAYPVDLLGDHPLAHITSLLTDYKTPAFDYIDHFFCGLLGYFSYDFVRYCEVLPDDNPDLLNMPDCYLMAPGEVIVFDHLKNELCVIVNVFSEEGPAGYASAAKRLESIISEIENPPRQVAMNTHAGDLNFVSHTKKDDFLQSIERAKEYIRDGDIFQVVISQRLSAAYDGAALPVYRALRNINPSPYLFYIELENASIVGSSPEMLVRMQTGHIETCPIAGTRPRGRFEAEDLKLEKELLCDEKEMSEHYMLVDLARNDVGKVSAFGTVKVHNIGHVERYSHVMHIVSNVEGTLASDCLSIDVLNSILPAGTLSGAPKVRAMEIIDELEPLRRGVYGGAIGYLGFDGNMDTCIAIRTAVIKDGQIHVQAGGGIVADSVPENEYQESMNKARAILAALEKAGGMV